MLEVCQAPVSRDSQRALADAVEKAAKAEPRPAKRRPAAATEVAREGQQDS
jgi:hypothetical protein